MPDIGEVARQPAREEEDGVDADVVAFAGKTGRQPFGGDRNPPQPVLIECHGGAFLAAARLDLDEGKDAAAPRNQVNFASGHPRTLGQDSPAVEA